MSKASAFIFSLLTLLLLCTETSLAKTEYNFSGKTMGTYYTVRFIAAKGESVSLWQKRVEMCLKRINKTFSMFDKSSRLSLFNSLKTGTCIKVFNDFYELLIKAQNIHQISEGAWDGTVKPLVDLWGFGTTAAGTYNIPEQQQISTAMTKVGFGHIKINKNNSICRNADVKLDLGSIAKGYGVDAVARLFINSGIHDVLVEIGGEIMASGKNKKRKPWRIGISRPEKDFTGQSIFKIVHLSNHALATSGTYRNFFEINGKTYSHIIDPKTGFPVKNAVVSASVISDNCTLADGLATAMMVMNPAKSLELADKLQNIECLIVTSNKGNFQVHMSEGFKRFLK